MVAVVEGGMVPVTMFVIGAALRMTRIVSSATPGSPTKSTVTSPSESIVMTSSIMVCQRVLPFSLKANSAINWTWSS